MSPEQSSPAPATPPLGVHVSQGQPNDGRDGVPVPRRVRVHHLRQAKERGERISMLTAYDAATAAILDEAGIDTLLVGDSIGNTMFGFDSTIPVTLDEMIPAVRAVTGATRRAFVIADLPFGSYEASPQMCHQSAVRVVKEAGAHAVKFEGGAHLAEHVRLLSQSGIPVVGHLGFTPQSENMLGGKRVQGRGDAAAEKLVEDALALQEAGAVMLVLEMVPASLAERITEVLDIPTIGIGAGVNCDGQVLVWTDMAGMTTWSPRFAKQFGQVGAELYAAARAYKREVAEGTFPAEEHSFKDQ